MHARNTDSFICRTNAKYHYYYRFKKKGKFMMAETAPETGKEIWKKFLTKHWNMVVLFVVGAILVSVGAILEY